MGAAVVVAVAELIADALSAAVDRVASGLAASSRSHAHSEQATRHDVISARVRERVRHIGYGWARMALMNGVLCCWTANDEEKFFVPTFEDEGVLRFEHDVEIGAGKRHDHAVTPADWRAFDIRHKRGRNTMARPVHRARPA